MQKYSMGLAVILGVMCLFALSVVHAEDYTSYRLGPIQWQIAEGGWATAEQGGLRVLGQQADASGGFYHVQSVENGCTWKFSWTFSQDITQISYSSGEIPVNFSIETDGGTCHTGFNPSMDIRADGDPTAITTVYEDYYNGGAFCVHPGGVCNPSPERRFMVYRETSVKETALVTIRIMGPRFANVGQHAEEIKYSYTGQTANSTTAPCTSYSGSLAESGHSSWQPDASGYSSATGGEHYGLLRGPAGADFDLYLYQWDDAAAEWVLVAASEGSTAEEEVSYLGAPGDYLWGIYAYNGIGDYTVCVRAPE